MKIGNLEINKYKHYNTFEIYYNKIYLQSTLNDKFTLWFRFHISLKSI